MNLRHNLVRQHVVEEVRVQCHLAEAVRKEVVGPRAG